MSACVADTHALIWYVLNAPELSANARVAMESAALAGDAVYVPTITLIEIIYLIEKGRFQQTLLTRILSALADPTRELKPAVLDENIVRALQQIPRAVVPDMPDRIIAATAFYLNLPLVTRDPQIKNVGSLQIIW